MAGKFREPFLISSLVRLEFRQSARLQVFRFATARTQGFSRRESQAILAAFEQNAASNFFQIAAVDWPDVHQISERISSEATSTEGFRTLDLLHVATALHLREKIFLTFDPSQARLARREGLTVPR